MDSTQPTPGNLPEGYHEDIYWKLSEDMRRVILMNLAALVLLVGSNLLFLRWRRLWYPGPFTFNLHLTDLLMLLGAILLTYVLHELTHGARMQLFGAHAQYGILWKGLMFYATAPGHAFKRNQYLSILLAPLIVGSGLALILLALPFSNKLAFGIAVCAAINFSGAVGDAWISLLVWRYPPNSFIVDEQDGMRIFTPM